MGRQSPFITANSESALADRDAASATFSSRDIFLLYHGAALIACILVSLFMTIRRGLLEEFIN